MFGSMFALPQETIPVVLNIDVPDRALTAVYIACLEQGDALDHQSRLRDAIGFAIKRAFVAAARTPDPYMVPAIPGGQVFLTPAPGLRLNLLDPTDGLEPRSAS